MTPSILLPSSPQGLSVWLESRGVDTRAWGMNGAKSVHDLWNEIQRGESELKNNPVHRLVRVTQLLICSEQRVLIEAAQTLADGSRRKINRFPAEKMLPGETPLKTAVRCLHEELQITPDNIQNIDANSQLRNVSKSSFSYPGLLTRYETHRVKLALNTLPSESFTTAETVQGGRDPVAFHHWEWHPYNECDQYIHAE